MRPKTLSFLFLLIFTLSGVKNVYSTHYLGGSITWKCLSNGKYKFYLKLYRDCTGITFGNSQTIYYNSINQIQLTLVSGYPKDISPVCGSPFIHAIQCNGASYYNTGAVSEYFYESQEIQLNGTPPASGWKFHWNGCCRGSAATNISSNQGYYLESVMYPYKGLPAYPCYDNSPDFAAPPAHVTQSGLYNSSETFAAFDDDLDELKYEWAPAMKSSIAPVSYVSGYSYSSPFPGISFNSLNIPVSLDTNTGFITFQSYTSGGFVACVKVSSYRDDIKIAEVNYESYFVAVAIGTDANPVFQNTTGNMYRDTVLAGDTVDLTLTANDNQYLQNNIPQSVIINAYGNEFGAYVPGTVPTYSTQSGCAKPPCATLTPAPIDTAPVTGVFTATVHFQWITDTAHVSGGPYLYNFFINAKDNFCSVPAQKSYGISIYVIPDFAYIKPQLKCTETKANGDVVLHYNTTIDTLNSFNAYYIYSALNKNGPFTLIDSVTNANTGVYTHVGANANQARRFYYIEMKSHSPSTGKIFYGKSNTLSTVYLDMQAISTCQMRLMWNRPQDTLIIPPSGYVYIYKKINSGNWFFADSVSNLTTQTFDYFNYIGDTVYYRVQFKEQGLKDSTGQVFSCYHKSSILRVTKSNLFAKSPPVTCAHTNSNGDVELEWEQYNGITGGFDFYKVYHANSYQGPYSLWQTLTNPAYNTSTFFLWGVPGPHYFYVETSAKDCYNNSILISPFDTVSNIFLYVAGQGTNLSLKWNKFRKTPLTSNAPVYYIYKMVSGAWQKQDSTSNTFYPITLSAGDSAKYMVSAIGYDRSGNKICEMNSNPTSYLKLGVKTSKSNVFKVYDNRPNPFSDFTFIRFFSPVSENIEITIFDLQGKEVLRRNFKAVAGNNSVKVSGKELGSGIYVYKVNNGKVVVTKRLTVY